MLRYIVRDLAGVLWYLPYGIMAGMLTAMILTMINYGRSNRGKSKIATLPFSCLMMYLQILLIITYFSRESGSRVGVMDLQLFSTWGINLRNNAYVVENVLLFIPYGFILPWAVARQRHFSTNLRTGAVTSLAIECMQLVTRRGYFQIDDILTNTLGTILGYLCYRIFEIIQRG